MFPSRLAGGDAGTYDLADCGGCERVSSLTPIRRGRYVASLAEPPSGVAEARVLRGLCFATDESRGDRFDQDCTHLLVKDSASGALVACCRVLLLDDGRAIERSYSAQFYDLSALAAFTGRMAEIGRFCVHPDWSDGDVLRVVWGAITRLVDDNKVAMLFGCSSFSGNRAEDYFDAFAMLKARHLSPDCWRPRIKAPEVYRFAARLRRQPDPKRAFQKMPPLLRTYLAMGGWVSDHAVIDREMNTLHVFTGLEIGAVPAARARALRAVAGQGR